MAQTTVDYTGIKSAGAWQNLAYVAADDSDKAQAAPDNVTGQIEVDDAPGDYNGSSINTVKFSVVDWDITGTPTRPKFLVVSWRKADTTLIHQYTTPEKSSTGEQTNGDATFVTPSGTSSLTASEWDNSYIEIVADEAGGKGDDVEILLDYVKIEVDYDVAGADPYEAILKRKPSPSRLWAHFVPALYVSVSVASAIAPAGYPPDLETVLRRPSPARQWAQYDPAPPQIRFKPPLPDLFAPVANRRARVSAFEQEVADEHPPWRPGIRPAVLWEYYLLADKPIFRPPVLIYHLDDNRGARVAPVPFWPRADRTRLLPELTHRQARISAFEQEVHDFWPPELYRRLPGPVVHWQQYALAPFRPGLRPTPAFIFTAPISVKARVSAYEFQTPDHFPESLYKRKPLRSVEPEPLRLPVRPVLVDLLDDNRAVRISAFEQEIPDEHPPWRPGVRPAVLWDRYAPAPLKQPTRPALVDLLDDNRAARVSAFEQQTPDHFPESLYRRLAPAAQPAPVWRPPRRPVSIHLLAPVASRRAQVSAFEQEVPAAVPTVLLYPARRPARQWDKYAPVEISSVQVVSGFQEIVEVKARISAFEQQFPDAPGDRLARISAFEFQVTEALPDVLLTRRPAIAARWDEIAPPTHIPRSVLLLHLPSQKVRVSAFEQEVPLSGVRALISAFELEAPIADRQAQLSAYELETPIRNQNVRLSAFEQEIPPIGRARLSAFEFSADEPITIGGYTHYTGYTYYLPEVEEE
jgi:hypothetical protein